MRTLTCTFDQLRAGDEFVAPDGLRWAGQWLRIGEVIDCERTIRSGGPLVVDAVNVMTTQRRLVLIMDHELVQAKLKGADQ